MALVGGSMKKFFPLLAILFLLTLPLVEAQTTAVSATVVDSDSTVWINGVWSLVFTPNPSYPNMSVYNINGTPLSSTVTSQAGDMNGTGALSFTVYDNSKVTPSGSTWTLSVCPLATAPCGIYNFSAVGPSINISAALTSLIPAPRFNPKNGAYGYIDGEAILGLVPGSTYYNVTQTCQRVFSSPPSSSWSCLGSGGGSTGCPTTGCAYSGPISGPIANFTTYQVGGVPLAAANLSNGTTGNGAVALANSAALTSPTISNPSFSGNIGNVVGGSANFTSFLLSGTPLAASNLSNGVTGTGAVVLATGATTTNQNLTTPTITTPIFVSAVSTNFPSGISVGGNPVLPSALAGINGSPTGTYKTIFNKGAFTAGDVPIYNTDGTIQDSGVGPGGGGSGVSQIVAGTNISLSPSGGTGVVTVNVTPVSQQTNGVNNTSQSGVNFINSSVNAVGLVATVSNPSTNQEKIEITGSYSGSTGSASNLLGGALGSVPFQTNTNVTTFLNSPTATGTYFLGWTPSGSALAPIAINASTFLASPPPIGAASPNTGKFTSLTATSLNSSPIVADITVTVGTGTIPANSCGSNIGSTFTLNGNTTATLTGAVAGQVPIWSDSADTTGVSGWGSTGGLYIKSYITSNTLNFKVCNPTSASITPSASVTFDVGVK